MKQADLDRNEIIEMARQAGFTVGYGSPALPKHEAFAKLVADVATAKEREACAKVCERDAAAWGYDSNGASCAIAIRARGQ